MMHLMPDGKLYVTRRDAGDVLLLTDSDKNGTFDELATATQFPGVHGIAVKDGTMFLCNKTTLLRYKIENDGLLSKTPDTLFKYMPTGGQHGNRTMHFGPDGNLYISVGSVCNDCKDGDKETASRVFLKAIRDSGVRPGLQYLKKRKSMFLTMPTELSI